MNYSAGIARAHAVAIGAFLAVAVLGATMVTTRALAAPTAPSAPKSAAGTLDLRAVLRLVSQLGACPPGVTASACATRTADGTVPGLGRVTEAYAWLADIGPPACANGFGKSRAYPVRLVVATKGDLDLSLAEGAQCIEQEPVRNQTQAFTITGGTGIYAGATGSGTVERSLSGETATGRVGRETWTATLTVPGLEFDVTAPSLSGAVSKSVRIPRRARTARVRFILTARDAVDGAFPVSCSPRSGSPFRPGRTRVTCNATDTSGNTATATFMVTVRVRR